MDLAGAKGQLPADQSGRVNILFITVDRRRDTPAVLERWLRNIDRDIIGLRGPGSVYLFGPQDRSVLYSAGATPDEYAHDMARLLRGS